MSQREGGDDRESERGRENLAERRGGKCGFTVQPLLEATSSSLMSSVTCSSDFALPEGMSPTALLESSMPLSNLLNSQQSLNPFPASDGIQNFPTLFKDDSEDLHSVVAGRISSRRDYDTLDAVISNPGSLNAVLNSESLISNADNLASLVPAETDDHSEELSDVYGDDFMVAADAGSVPEDGFLWRKYGNKPVKGSTHPRSYYRCTDNDCGMKKVVERDHDGEISEIIYKSSQNHPRPPATRLASIPSPKAADIAGCRAHSGSNGIRILALPERFSAASVVTEPSDPFRAAQGMPLVPYDHTGALEFSSTSASELSSDESESKRRRVSNYMLETFASRPVREPRVIVQIESDVDILDDGYRWRKYGQKVVKGNPNPRSYYKCTASGCVVRKHVERAPHDVKFVVTSYEGKHNHDAPAGRSSSQASSSNGGPLSSLPEYRRPTLAESLGFARPTYDGRFGIPLPAYDGTLGHERLSTYGGFPGEGRLLPFGPQRTAYDRSFGNGSTQCHSFTGNLLSGSVPSFLSDPLWGVNYGGSGDRVSYVRSGPFVVSESEQSEVGSSLPSQRQLSSASPGTSSSSDPHYVGSFPS